MFKSKLSRGMTVYIIYQEYRKVPLLIIVAYKSEFSNCFF